MTPDVFGKVIGGVLAAAMIYSIAHRYTASARFKNRPALRKGLRGLVAVFIAGPVLGSAIVDFRAEREAASEKEILEGCMESCTHETQLGEPGCGSFCRCQLTQLTSSRSAAESVAYIQAHTRADGTQDEELTRVGQLAGERCRAEK